MKIKASDSGFVWDGSGVDLLAVIGRDVQLRRRAGTNGGEWKGPCPFCGGEDRLYVHPTPVQGKPHWQCRQCNNGGDAIQYRRDKDGLSFHEACQALGIVAGESGDAPSPRPAAPSRPPLAPPSPEWQARGRSFVDECESALWGDAGQRTLAWLHGRALTDDTIRLAHLGYNGSDRHEERSVWGLAPEADDKDRPRRVWLPRGVVIPWESGGDLWRINIRRPSGEPKYIGPAGWANGLYNADALQAGRPAMLLEGEINALTVQQYAGDVVVPVATGSTGGAHRTRWLARLAVASGVLVAYDSDANGAGDEASAYWLGLLSNAKRWRPYWSDANDMAQDGADVRGWVVAGLAHQGAAPIAPAAEANEPEETAMKRNVSATTQAPLAAIAERDISADAIRRRFREAAAVLLAELEALPELSQEQEGEASYYRSVVSPRQRVGTK